MNDPTTAAERHREIVLAREAPFRLASTTVLPASLEVKFQSETTSLEPRVMKVLVALSRMGGLPASREILIDCCWAGRVVTDGALNRSIAQLRKALRDPGIQIETIPRIGYRLQAVTVEPLHGSPQAEQLVRTAALGPAPSTAPASATAVATAASASEPATAAATAALATAGAAAAVGQPVTSAKNTQRLLWALAAVLVLGAGTWWFTTSNRTVIWTASEFRPLTSTAEQETFPALSPEGTQIVYAVRPDAYSARDLYLRNVDEGTPVRLTTDPRDDYGAAWSPDGSRIAFARSSDEGPCALVVVAIPLGAERTVAPCQASAETRPSWLDARTLVFSDRLPSQPVPRVRAVDIETGAVRDLTTPSASTLGDSDPQAAPDGQHIAFRRSLAVGADDLLVLDVRSGREQAVTTDGWKASGYVWSADSRHIFFASNRGGDFGLWSVDRRGRSPPRRVSLGLGTVSFNRMSADRQNRLAVELTHGQSKLARVRDPQHTNFVTSGAGADGDPAVGPDGSIAHVSNRGGTYEIWLLSKAGTAVRLTSIQGSYVLEPSWSRDGSRIAFVGVKGRKAEVYTVTRDGSKLQQLTDDDGAKRDPVFTASGKRLLYLARANGAWRLMELDLDAGTPPRAVARNEGWVTLRATPDGTVLGRHEGEDFVRRVDPLLFAGSGVQEASFYPESSPRLAEIDSWTVGSNGFYVRRGRHLDRPSSLWFFPWQGPERKLADVPLASGNIAADHNGDVIFSQSTSMEVDLAMVELRPVAD